MKIQAGKIYRRQDGNLTGRLQLNPKQSICYPYLDPVTELGYTETGTSDIWDNDNNLVDEIVDNIYDLSNYQPVMIADAPGECYENDMAQLLDENKRMRKTIKEHVKVFQQLQRIAVKNRSTLPEEMERFIFNAEKV